MILRRSNSLVVTFEDADLVVENYVENTKIAVSSEVLRLLSVLGIETSYIKIVEFLGGDTLVVNALMSNRVLLTVGSAEERKDASIENGWVWGHDARYFHFGSRISTYESDVEVQQSLLSKLAQVEPPPSPYTELNVPFHALASSYDELGSLSEALSNRRTCRRFRREEMQLKDLEDLLLWTWGQSAICPDRGAGQVLLKTSPSGGARHPIEVYPVVFRVSAMEAGIYHYNVRQHGLELLSRGSYESEVVRLMGNQAWVGDSACAFFMTCVHKRSSWKYSFSRAYRVVHLDAGHLGQTFHLVCTALGLGPFTTAATDDQGIEEFLHLHPAEEFPIYCAAVGKVEIG